MGTRRIVHQGGQWSGKTVGILQAHTQLCAEEPFDGLTNGITTVTSQSFPHLKGGALADFEAFIYPDFKGAIRSYNRTDHVFTFRSGNKLEFKVFENEMRARGAKRKRLFINEANSFPYMIYFQLDSRSEQSTIDYNPSIRFWAHEKLIDHDGVQTFYSDHRHNPFLKESKHKEIEGYYDATLEHGGELFKVYSRGITGNVTGIIYPNWQMIDDSDFPGDKDWDWIFSVDFGYTIDPTAVVKTCKIGNTLFVKELAYETGMSPLAIKQIIDSNGYIEESPVYCEHDPDMIRLLRNAGVYYAQPTRKGQGSVNAGIELIKRFTVKYPQSSRNLHRERGLYIWDTDRLTGKNINIPVDKNNHCMDAIRYGVYPTWGLRTMAAA